MKAFFTWTRKHWLLTSLIVIGVIVGVWWFGFRTAGDTEEYVTQKPRVGELIKTISVSGRVDAEEKVRMRFAGGGEIVYLGAEEGRAVRQGQVIATIDQALLQKQLQKDLNNYMKERWDWEQLRDDVVENGDDIPDIVPELETRRTVDKAQWDLENSVLDVEIRTIAISDTNLIAPFNGIMTFMPANSEGTFVGATDYFELINPETLVFKAEVDEQDIGQIRIGQLGTVALDAFEDTDITARVSYIPFTSSSSSTGTVYVIELPLTTYYQQYPLRLGMSGDVDIEVAREDGVLAVPIEAIRQRDGVTYVDVLQNGKKEERVVVTGLETEDEIEIERGVQENDDVIIPQ